MRTQYRKLMTSLWAECCRDVNSTGVATFWL